MSRLCYNGRLAMGCGEPNLPLYHISADFVKSFFKKNCTIFFPKYCAKLPIAFLKNIWYNYYSK